MACVLVVDDDPEIRGLLRVMIEAEGHEVLEAANAEQALQALDAQPEAIFVDVDMPRMTGAQFLIQLRQHPRVGQTPATFVTAHGDRVGILVQAGLAKPYILAKPFRRAELLRALSRMLAGVQRRNLRVSLHPAVMAVRIEAEQGGHLIGLSPRELLVQSPRFYDKGSIYELELIDATHSVTLHAGCAGTVRGVTRFYNVSQGVDVAPIIEALLADPRHHLAQRKGERAQASVLVSWQREGTLQHGFLRDISSSGAYLVSDVQPPMGTEVMVQLPFKPSKKTPLQLRGCMAVVRRHGIDGFGCEFAEPSTEFCIAVNALLSDGTVIAGEGKTLQLP